MTVERVEFVYVVSVCWFSWSFVWFSRICFVFVDLYVCVHVYLFILSFLIYLFVELFLLSLYLFSFYFFYLVISLFVFYIC